MRILTLLLAICFMFSVQVVNAESFLIVHKQSREILSLSNEDDAQLPNDEYEKIIIPDNFKEIELNYHPTMYFFKNGKFIVNIQKISNIEIAREKAEKANKRELKIQSKLEELAIKEIQKEEPSFK